MEFSPELTKIAFVVFAALSVGGLAIGLLFPYFSGQADVNRRARRVTSGEVGTKAKSWWQGQIRRAPPSNSRHPAAI